MLAKDIEEVLISEEQIQEKIRELGAVLNKKSTKISIALAIGVLKGGIAFHE